MNPIAIVGGGAAGIGCALSAAIQGHNVVLVEKTAQLGGTVAQALIHTLGGLFDDQGNFLNTGLPMELAARLGQASPYTQKRRIGKTWVLNVDPSVYTQVINDWIRGYPNIEICYNASISAVAIRAKQVKQIDVAREGTTRVLETQALVDTTGMASVVRQIDTGLVSAGMALAGFIVQLRGVAPDALRFPKGAGILRQIRKATDKGELPPECATVWLDRGVYPDEVYAKFNLTAEGYDPAGMKDAAKRLAVFLQSLPGFSESFINVYGRLGIRDGGQIIGEYCLTERDVKEGSRFADVACRACWPIEHWHPQKGISLEYLPDGQDYDIPLRSLRVAGFENLWAAGKCLSAEPRAQASARVVGTCWAMGEAVGKNVIEGTLR